jgi:hypothetical protein
VARIALVLALILLASTPSKAAGGRSCYGDSCRDKIMQQTACRVSIKSVAPLLLRSLPRRDSQAVGFISDGDEAAIADQSGAWVFVQSSSTFEGQTERAERLDAPLRAHRLQTAIAV